MAKIFYNAMLLGICVQLSCYLFWAFASFGGLISYPFGNASELTNLQSMFSLNSWAVLVTAAGAGISVVMLLFKQGTYALYALLIFAFGIFFKIVSTFVLAIPNTIAALVAPMLPNGEADPILLVVGVIVLFGGFIYLFGLVIQRDPVQG